MTSQPIQPPASSLGVPPHRTQHLPESSPELRRGRTKGSRQGSWKGLRPATEPEGSAETWGMKASGPTHLLTQKRSGPCRRAKRRAMHPLRKSLNAPVPQAPRSYTSIFKSLNCVPPTPITTSRSSGSSQEIGFCRD